MARPPVFDKFRDVQAELERSGLALFKDTDGSENLIIHYPYLVNYIHSYAEDTPFFLGLAEGRLKGSRCTNRRHGFVFATPRSHCMFCGRPTEWVDLPTTGKLHSWTTCHFGSEAFLKETPYNLALVEFEGAGQSPAGPAQGLHRARDLRGHAGRGPLRAEPQVLDHGHLVRPDAQVDQLGVPP